MKPLFENEHFLLIDKRPGFLSVPSRMGLEDSRPCELAEWSKLKGRLWATHRLDEEVSGLLLFAKSAESHKAANGWFENRLVKKQYQALTEEQTPYPKVDSHFVWKSLLLRGKKRAYEKPFGKPSETRATFRGNGLWVLEPLTGRSHQLRYELMKHGYPVLGDTLYGSKLPCAIPQAIALRAVRLEFSACPDREKFGLPGHFECSDILSWIES